MIGWTWKRPNHWTWDRPNPSLSPIEIKIKHCLGGFGTVTTFNPYNMKQPWITMVNETLLGVIIQVGSFLHSLYATWSSSVWCNFINVQKDSVSSTTLLLGHVEATYWYLRPNRCDPSLCFFSTILRLMEDIRSTNWHTLKTLWSMVCLLYQLAIKCRMLPWS